MAVHMDETSLPPPPPPVVEYCYRHPDVETGVHCTRCGPDLHRCMIPAPVGHQCPDAWPRPGASSARVPEAVAVANRGAATMVLLVMIGAVFVLEVVVGGPGSLMTGPTSLNCRPGRLGRPRPARRHLVGIATGQYWRLMTAVFLHAGLFHIAFNAYALWIFGTVVEEELGRLRFLLIFFATGFFASAASYAFGPLTVPAWAPRERSSGSSGRSSPTTTAGGTWRSPRRGCGRRSCSS